jgi:flavodoxin
MTKKLVIYDTVFGNTAKVAETIGEALGPETTVKRVSDISANDLADVNILFVGSPTRAFRPTEGITNFLNQLSKDALKGVRAAAFDTRIHPEDINPKFFRFLFRTIGYADRVIARKLKSAGAELALEPDGFGVQESEGPLKEGEIERAAAWAKGIDD